MSYKAYTYNGGAVPILSHDNHADFLLILQKALIYSLNRKNLLTDTQCRSCIAELDRQYKDSP